MNAAIDLEHNFDIYHLITINFKVTNLWYELFVAKVNKNMGKYKKKICNHDSDPIADSANPADPTEEEKEDDHFGIVLYSESLDEEPKPNRKSAKQKKCTHKYKASWEQIDGFKDWLQPSDKPEYLAFCLVCNAYLKGAAGRNDIAKHSKTEVHLKNSRQFNLKKVADYKPRSSKKRQSNAKLIASQDTPPTNFKQEEVQSPDSEFEFCGIDSIDEDYTPADNKTAKRINQPIMYNPSWEKTDAFRHWIRPSDKPNYVAYCSLCKVYLKGSSGRNDITKHLLTDVHLNHVKTGCQMEESDVDEPSTLKKKLFKLEKKNNKEPELVKKCSSFVETSRDDSQIFGDYVASAIRDLTDDRNKKRLKLMIQKSIIEVQETDGESVEDIPQRTYYSNTYTPVASILSEAPLQVASTEEVKTANVPSESNGVLPVQVEAAQGQYRYNLLC